ncbi:hypothetical protein V6Z11_A05G255700 [Gossypium hirsutum]
MATAHHHRRRRRPPRKVWPVEQVAVGGGRGIRGVGGGGLT